MHRVAVTKAPGPAERLAQAIEAAERTARKGPQCTVCALDPELRVLVASARDQGKAATIIASGLKAIGHKILGQTVARHFREGHHVVQG